MTFFTKEVKIALTAIAAGILLFFGINFFKGINLFKPSNSYTIQFADVTGLTVSSSVYANGYPIGTVRAINYDYKNGNRVFVEVEVDDEMRNPRSTHAELVAQMLGGVTMSHILGPNTADVITPSDTIYGYIHQGALEKMEAMVPVIEQLIPKLDSILDNVNRLTGDPALTATLHNTAALTADLRTATNHLDRLLTDDVPRITNRLDRVGANVETLSNNLANVDVAGTVQNVNTTLENANDFMHQLTDVASNLNTKMNSRDNSLGLLLTDRALYDNLNGTARSADSLLIDLKAHPKRYVHFSVFGKKDK